MIEQRIKILESRTLLVILSLIWITVLFSSPHITLRILKYFDFKFNMKSIVWTDTKQKESEERF